MKYFFLSTAIASSLSAAAQTPADSTDSDTIEVVITPESGQDSTIVQLGKMKIIVLENTDKGTDQIIIDREQPDTLEASSECEDDDDKVSHWAGIRVGVNGYLVNDALPIPATHDFLELDYAKSIAVDLNLFEHDFRLYKNNVELVTGLGLKLSSYAFRAPHSTLTNADPLTVIIDSSTTYSKNKLKATYVTAPLMLGFSTNQDEDKAIRFAFGGQVGWRIASKLKQRFYASGETVTPKVRSDFDLNPFLFSAVATAGYGPLNVFAGYGLNTLFESGKTIALTPFDVGLQLMF